MESHRALLDQLMGRFVFVFVCRAIEASSSNFSHFLSLFLFFCRDRDVPLDQKVARHFSDSDVCKYYLCGLSPYSLFQNTKSDGILRYDRYSKVRDETLRAEWNRCTQEVKDKYGYERDLLDFLEELIVDIDRKIERQKRRVRDDKMAEIKGIGEALKRLNAEDRKQLRHIIREQREVGENLVALLRDGNTTTSDTSLSTNVGIEASTKASASAAGGGEDKGAHASTKASAAAAGGGEDKGAKAMHDEKKGGVATKNDEVENEEHKQQQEEQQSLQQQKTRPTFFFKGDPTKPIRAACVALSNRGQLLCQEKRSNATHYSTMSLGAEIGCFLEYSLPGGKTDTKDASAKDTAFREFIEELNLKEDNLLLKRQDLDENRAYYDRVGKLVIFEVPSKSRFEAEISQMGDVETHDNIARKVLWKFPDHDNWHRRGRAFIRNRWQSKEDLRIDQAIKLLQRAQTLREMRAKIEAKSNHPALSETKRHLVVCEVSGCLLSSADSVARLSAHFSGKQYVGWKKIRDKFEQLRRQNPPRGLPSYRNGTAVDRREGGSRERRDDRRRYRADEDDDDRGGGGRGGDRRRRRAFDDAYSYDRRRVGGTYDAYDSDRHRRRRRRRSRSRSRERRRGGSSRQGRSSYE